MRESLSAINSALQFRDGFSAKAPHARHAKGVPSIIGAPKVRRTGMRCLSCIACNALSAGDRFAITERRATSSLLTGMGKRWLLGSGYLSKR